MPASSQGLPPRTAPPRLGLLSIARALASPWRSPRQRPVHPALGLGVGPLPDGMGQLPLGAPVALVAQDGPSAALWFPALLADAVSAAAVFLVVPSAEEADHLLEHAALHSAHAQGQLAIWVMAPGLPQQVRAHGLRTFFGELHSVGLQPHHALYVLGAQRLVAGLGVAPLQRLGEQLRLWCLEREQPVVLGFSPSPAPDGASLLPLLRGLCNTSLHLATLSAGADQSILYFERWNADSGAVFQSGLGMRADPQTQRLRHDGSRTQGQGQALLEAPDQYAVIATRAAVSHQPGVPRHWHIVDNLDDVAVATAQSIGATVLLDAGHIAEFDDRARLVHQLRQTRPPTLKIVVRENAGKLRSHSEQALLQLGANAVFYRELGFSRLLQLLQDIHAHSYTRSVSPDYAQALHAFMPAPERGYQPAPRFSHLVRDMLARTQDIGLAHSMVRLDIAPQIAHLTALRACKVSRDGDLLTAGRSALYVFLFACREPDIEAALQRLFDVPLAQLFTAQSTDCSALGIQALLESLDSAARQGLPDYSSSLALPTPAMPAMPAPPPSGQPQPAAPPALPQAAPLSDPPAPATRHAERPSLHPRAIGQRSRGTPRLESTP